MLTLRRHLVQNAVTFYFFVNNFCVWTVCFSFRSECFEAASFPDVSLTLSLSLCAQRAAGRRKGERRLADLVFKMAECSMEEDYVIFKNKFRPFHFAYSEQKNSMSTFSVPRGGCFLSKKWTSATLQNSTC